MKVGNLVRNKRHIEKGMTHVIGVVIDSSDALKIAQVKWFHPVGPETAFMYKWGILEIISEVKNESK